MTRGARCEDKNGHSLEIGRQGLAAAQAHLFECAAAAHARGLVSADEIVRVRSLMKAGAAAKVTSAARAEQMRVESEAFAQSLEQRLGITDAEPSRGEAPARGGDAVTRRADGDGGTHTGEVPEGSRGPTPGELAIPAPGPAETQGPGVPQRGRGRPPKAKSARSRRSLAELSPEELAEAAERRTVVDAMANGATAAAALRLIGRGDTPAARRWAQRVYQRYAKDGQLFDRRHTPQSREPKVMTGAVASTAELLWLHHRDSAASAIRRRIAEMIAELTREREAGKDISYHPLGQAILEGSAEVPSIPTLYRFFESLGEDKAKIRALGFSEWVRQARPTTKDGPWALHANERWEIDHTRLDTHVRTLGDDGLWRPARPWLTAVIDVYSRAIMGLVLSLRTPDAFTTAIVLRRAILPKPEWPAWTPRGLPRLLVLDNGRDFQASDVAASLNALGIQQQFCDPHTPDQKPHIERWFGTLTRNLLPMLPGYVDGNERGDGWSQRRVDRLLLVPQLRANIERWVVEFYHREVHHTTQRRPVELWEESVPEVKVPLREDLDVFLLQTDERKVSRGFIRFSPERNGRKRLYYAPALLGANGRRVLLRYNPDDLASVMVYDLLTRERLGEAWDVNAPASPFSKQSIREQARDFRERIGREVRPLIQRGEAYYEHIAAHDRIGTKRSAPAEREMRDMRAAADAKIAEAERELATPGFLTASEAAAAEEDEMAREMKERMRAAARSGRSRQDPTGQPAPATLSQESAGLRESPMPFPRPA